jgi:hypothetical protein
VEDAREGPDVGQLAVLHPAVHDLRRQHALLALLATVRATRRGCEHTV